MHIAFSLRLESHYWILTKYMLNLRLLGYVDSFRFLLGYYRLLAHFYVIQAMISYTCHVLIFHFLGLNVMINNSRQYILR